MKTDFLNRTQGRLIVSCQALNSEPLYGSQMMARMAYAAALGGAAGIRANTIADIIEIKKTVELPIIGIIKQVYPNSPVFITPTLSEIEALVQCGVDVIALDATSRVRPDGKTIQTAFPAYRKAFPTQLFMADCATYEECLCAQELGFDIVGTTLRSYTEQSQGAVLPDMELLGRLGRELHLPVIAEGGIWTPEQLHTILALPGIHAAVIGAAITRPMEITKRFIAAI